MRIIFIDEKAIYITDTRTIKGIVAKNYDLYLIEANYDDKEIQERINEKEIKGEYISEYRTINSHLSINETAGWLLDNMGDNGTYEYIHQHKKREENKND